MVDLVEIDYRNDSTNSINYACLDPYTKLDKLNKETHIYNYQTDLFLKVLLSVLRSTSPLIHPRPIPLHERYDAIH